MPSAKELIANGRNSLQISEELGVDRLIYQSLEDLLSGCQPENRKIARFETSCFTGEYVAGDITPKYLQILEDRRNDKELAKQMNLGNQLDLNLASDE